ncbi:hypothetical protein MTO96_014243 [Rhipicephalus appendiculatus]
MPFDTPTPADGVASDRPPAPAGGTREEREWGSHRRLRPLSSNAAARTRPRGRGGEPRVPSTLGDQRFSDLERPPKGAPVVGTPH